METYLNLSRDQLIQRLQSAESVLEFYADKKNWRMVTIQDRAALVVDDLELTNEYEDEYCRQGGKRAREHFERWKDK